MRRLKRAALILAASCAPGTALWGGLQFGFGIDLGAASAAGLALAAVVAGAVGAAPAWDALAPAASQAQKPGRHRPYLTGSLKAVKSSFVDRHDEWRAIKGWVRTARNGKQIQAAIMIHGMPGVGKSEFALYAAHRLVAMFTKRARRAGLPMVVRQVELHGLEGVARVDPKDALGNLLNMDSADAGRAKLNLDQLSDEWRNHLQGKFLILLLDNVDDADQVLPFLPGGSSFIMLITGRRVPEELAGRVTAYRLDVLDQVGARQMIQMITKVAGRPVRRDPQEVIAEIVRLCDYLPEAITLAASPLALDARIPATRIRDQLTSASDKVLGIEGIEGKANDGMARSFGRSYEQLSGDEKLVLRRLGLAPTLTINVEAAAALANISVELAEDSLRKLAAASLIEIPRDGESHHEHYAVHDLIRRYARSLTTDDDPAENEAAVIRLLTYYHQVADFVDTLLTRQPPPKAIESPAATVRHEFADRQKAIAWVRAELPNLLACADYVVKASRDATRVPEKHWVIMLATALAGILRNEGLWQRSIELQTQALNAAEEINSPLAAANALSERGLLGRLVGDLDTAASDLERAISLYQQCGGRQGRIGEAHALNTYGVVLDQRHQPAEGRQRLAASLDICRSLQHQLGEANVLQDQGMAEFFAKNNDDALARLSQALTLYQAVGQPLGMAHAHGNLARAQQRAGAEQDTLTNLEAARTLYHELGNRLGELNCRIQLGAAFRQNDSRRAKRILKDAVIFSRDEIKSRLGHINALDELAEVYFARGHYNSAERYWNRAIEIARHHGIRREEERILEKMKRLREISRYRRVLRRRPGQTAGLQPRRRHQVG